VLNCIHTTTPVYRAWTDPNHLKNWWGPAGFTNTFNEYDLRVGGRWHFIMHGPDKGNYVNECEFIKIDPPSLPTFEEVSPDQTKLVFKMLFNTADECRKVKTFAVDKNEENFHRLENELTEMTL
jgi:uncharacterized protein YndB with AHSA1/START domain